MSDDTLNETEIEDVYTTHNIDYEKILEFQNTLDNLRFDLLEVSPELLKIESEEDFKLVINGALKEVFDNNLIVIDEDVAGEMTARGRLEPWEVWNCVTEAVLIGGGSWVGLQGLKAAGLKVITKVLTKVLTKFAGPIGVAITIADFGFCIWEHSND